MRRLRWGTIENLNRIIDDYFVNEPIPTISGLLIRLDIRNDCWIYYLNEHWRTWDKTDEQLAMVTKSKVLESDSEAYEEWLEIVPVNYDAGFSMTNKDDNDALKALITVAFKKAHAKYTNFIEHSILTKPNAAGAIFLAKATLGYREIPPEDKDTTPQSPKITINILNAQQNPRVEVIDANPAKIICAK